MSSIIEKLHKKSLIKPPTFIVGGTQYETIMGSEAYGVATDFSDKDIYGFCIPPKDYIFPHLSGKIIGFSTNIQKFEQYQQHHIRDVDSNVEYDVTIFGIVKYFSLLMENNPNIIDSLYTRDSCVLHTTPVGRIVRDNKQLFLSKKIWHKFKGYAFSQLSKMETKNPDPTSRRYESVLKYGMDLKFAYHVVRLMNEARQLLANMDLDLTLDNSVLKAIRNGEWTKEDIKRWFSEQEKTMEELYRTTKLPHVPREKEITELLIHCLEEHFGSLDNIIKSDDYYKQGLVKIRDIINTLQI